MCPFVSRDRERRTFSKGRADFGKSQSHCRCSDGTSRAPVVGKRIIDKCSAVWRILWIGCRWMAIYMDWSGASSYVICVRCLIRWVLRILGDIVRNVPPNKQLNLGNPQPGQSQFIAYPEPKAAAARSAGSMNQPGQPWLSSHARYSSSAASGSRGSLIISPRRAMDN